MSEENVEITRRAFDLFVAGGIEAALVCFASDVVAHPFPEWVEDSEYRGHDGQRALVTVWTENFDEFGFTVSERRELGDKVLTLGETYGRIKGSGVPIRQPLASVFSNFHDGMIGEIHYFTSWAQALEFVGLRE